MGKCAKFCIHSQGRYGTDIRNNAVFNVSRHTFEQLQWIIPVTKKSLSEQCEGGLKCCATGKPEKLLRIERMCSVIPSANQRPVSPT